MRKEEREKKTFGVLKKGFNVWQVQVRVYSNYEPNFFNYNTIVVGGFLIFGMLK